MTLTIPILILLLLSAAVRPAGAFGVLGHQVIAAIAEDMLTPKAKAEVNSLLATSGAAGTSSGAGGPSTLASASTWADEIRTLRPHTRPWHYVTLQISEAGYDSARADSTNVIKAIKRQLDVLATPGADRYAREEALKWVVHLVGDLHQPLHAGEDHDKGGNLAKVKVNRRTYNLHEVWDHVILERLHLPLDSLRPMLERRMAADTGFAARYAQGTVESWADDTHAKARACYLVNGRPMRKGIKMQLDKAYLDAATLILLEQMEKGAVRLAFALNRALDPQGSKAMRVAPLRAGPRGAGDAAFFASADPIADAAVSASDTSGASDASDAVGAYAWSVNSGVFHHSSCADVVRIQKKHLRRGDSPPPGKKLHKGCPIKR
jgi:hypothetical protein